MSSEALPASGSVAARLLRGYGPLVAFAVIFALMAVYLPSKVHTSAPVAAEQAPTTQANTPLTGTKGTAGVAGKLPTAATTAQIQKALANVKGSCPDRNKQIPGDPYSPPCIAFSGSNGGATTRGVTGSEIKISFRVLNEKGFDQTLAALAGAQIADTPD